MSATNNSLILDTGVMRDRYLSMLIFGFNVQNCALRCPNPNRLLLQFLQTDINIIDGTSGGQSQDTVGSFHT